MSTKRTVTREELLENLDRLVKQADRARKELKDRADTCSLDFAENDVETITKTKVFARLAKMLRAHPEMSQAEVHHEALGEVLRFAKFGHRSTSLLSNICASAEASAWAEVVEMLGGI
jgi:uncharacterized protein (DUF924 family)